MLKEFREFIAKGNVMDMAVGITIGGIYFTNLFVVQGADVVSAPLLGG